MSHVMNRPWLVFAALPVIGAALGVLIELIRGARA